MQSYSTPSRVTFANGILTFLERIFAVPCLFLLKQRAALNTKKPQHQVSGLNLGSAYTKDLAYCLLTSGALAIVLFVKLADHAYLAPMIDFVFYHVKQNPSLVAPCIRIIHLNSFREVFER